MLVTGAAGLEVWCRRVTGGYAGVNIANMTESWRDGLAFCAIIHRFRPQLLQYNNLKAGQVKRLDLNISHTKYNGQGWTYKYSTACNQISCPLRAL